MRCVFDKSGKVSVSRAAGAIRSLVNARSLQLEGARFLYESLLVPVLTYFSETTILREKRGPGLGQCG